jgi:hypothetical protein
MATTATANGLEAVSTTLENYAARGVFRAFGKGPSSRGKYEFRLVWHRDQKMRLLFDARSATLRFPDLLPEMPNDSEVFRELKAFVKSRQADALPEHRRIDPERAQVRLYNRGGSVSLNLKVLDEDFAYGTERLINLVHELFVAFFTQGHGYEYLIETFELDPDDI